MASATLNVRPTTDEATILALIEDRHRAHHNKDAAAIAAPYASDVISYDLAPPLAHHGINLKEKAGMARHMGRSHRPRITRFQSHCQRRLRLLPRLHTNDGKS